MLCHERIRHQVRVVVTVQGKLQRGRTILGAIASGVRDLALVMTLRFGLNIFEASVPGGACQGATVHLVARVPPCI